MTFNGELQDDVDGVDGVDDEVGALAALLIAVAATKASAAQLMRDYPQHEKICTAIVGVTTDIHADIRSTIARMGKWVPRRPDR